MNRFERRQNRPPIGVDTDREVLSLSQGDLMTYGPLGLKNAKQKLGSSAELGLRLPEGRRATLVYASANNKGHKRAVGDSLASALAITCSYRLDNDAAKASPPRVLGLIKWGNDGHQAQAYFDWLNGTVVQVTASSVEVSCELVDSPTPDNLTRPIDPAARVNVGAFVGYRSSSRKSPTLTDLVAIPAPTDEEPGFVYLPIPEFARSVAIYGVPPDQAQWCSGPDSTAFQFAPVDTTVIKSSANYQRPGPATHLYLQSETSAFMTVVWELVL